MQIPDSLIIKYFQLATDIHPDEIKNIKNELEDPKINPRDIKMRLAKEITSLYHSAETANLAEEQFKSVFQKKQLPEDIPEVSILSGDTILDVIVKAKLTASKSEARRLILQGGVRLNGEVVTDFLSSNFNNEDLIQVGKRKFAKVIFSS